MCNLSTLNICSSRNVFCIMHKEDFTKKKYIFEYIQRTHKYMNVCIVHLGAFYISTSKQLFNVFGNVCIYFMKNRKQSVKQDSF